MKPRTQHIEVSCIEVIPRNTNDPLKRKWSLVFCIHSRNGDYDDNSKKKMKYSLTGKENNNYYKMRHVCLLNCTVIKKEKKKYKT